jgi:hypothetical protein
MNSTIAIETGVRSERDRDDRAHGEPRAQQRQRGQCVAEQEAEPDRHRDRGDVPPAERSRENHPRDLAGQAAGLGSGWSRLLRGHSARRGRVLDEVVVQLSCLRPPRVRSQAWPENLQGLTSSRERENRSDRRRKNDAGIDGGLHYLT